LLVGTLDPKQLLDSPRYGHQRIGARLTASAAAARPLAAGHVEQRPHAIAVPFGESMFLAGLHQRPLKLLVHGPS
jgi:hypothetical protein